MKWQSCSNSCNDSREICFATRNGVLWLMTCLVRCKEIFICNLKKMYWSIEYQVPANWQNFLYCSVTCLKRYFFLCSKGWLWHITQYLENITMPVFSIILNAGFAATISAPHMVCIVAILSSNIWKLSLFATIFLRIVAVCNNDIVIFDWHD